MIYLAISLFLLQAVNSYKCPMPQHQGTFKHKEAAFLDILPNGQGGVDLFISSFSPIPFVKGAISRVSNIGLKMSSISTITSEKIAPKVTWPNGVKPIPKDALIAGLESASQRVISCGGFLVPSHGNGACTAYGIDENDNVTSVVLARAGPGHFFHQGEFYDVDGDGLKDLLTAKASKSMFGTTDGAMYWYKNPGQYGGKWEEKLLFKGPDVHFEIVDLDNDGLPEIIASQFFSKALTVNWVKKGGKFMNTSDWKQRAVIKEKLGELFNVTLVDINADGRKEILFTNHVTDASLAGVYALEIPENFKEDEFKLHVISTGFPTLNKGPGQASPGGVLPFFLNQSKYPTFIVSGDGNQKAHIICYDNKSREWKREELMNVGNTVGAIALSDVDGDGNPEMFVPSYEKGEIYVYSY